MDITKATLEKLAARGSKPAAALLADMAELERDEAAREAARKREETARAERERVHEVRWRLEPQAGDAFIDRDSPPGTGVVDVEGRRYQLVGPGVVNPDRDHAGPWFAPAPLLEHARVGARPLSSLPKLWLSHAQIKRCRSITVLVALFSECATKQDVTSEAQARAIDARLREIGINLVERSGIGIGKAIAAAEELFGVGHVPGAIATVIDPSRIETTRQLVRSQAAQRALAAGKTRAEGGDDAA